MVDYDNQGRSQAVDVLDASYNTLATQTFSSFQSGVWAEFTASGHVKLRFRSLNTKPATVSAVCFDPSVTGTAAYVSSDTATQGAWKGTYGRDGYVIPGDGLHNPTYVAPLASGETLSQFATYPTSNPLMLQKIRGLVYKAVSEPVYTASHNKRWVKRNTVHMPQNVYVDGVLAGVPSTVNGEFLTVKTS
jgi:hypothetical protein